MFFTSDKLDQIKLIDFGSSDDLLQPEIRNTFIDHNAKRGQHKYFVGTSQYMPPECMHNKPTTKASDIWTLGCILYQLYIGLTPFRGASDYLIFKLSDKADMLKFEEYSEHILPQAAKQFILKMIQIKQEDRIEIDQVLQDPFFDSVKELKTRPPMEEQHVKLQNICKDFITRGNVHRFSGIEEFTQKYQAEIVTQFDM